MKYDSLCPICGEGTLVEKTTQINREINGVHRLIPLHSSECDCCGTELATPTQTRTNKRVMIAFDKEANGLLTGAQVCKIREKLRLTKAEAAKLFGGGPIAFNKYENNDITQSVAMDKLIRLAADVPEAFDYLKNGCSKVVESTEFFGKEFSSQMFSVEQMKVKVYAISTASVQHETSLPLSAVFYEMENNDMEFVYK